MRVFVSGKVGDERTVRHLMQELVRRGHDITFDWTQIDHLKPYDANPALSAEAAALEVQGVRDAEVLIVLPSERGVGLFVEVGIALGLGKRVFVLSDRPASTMFFHHPLVTRVRTRSELFDVLDSPAGEVSDLPPRS